MLESAAYSRLSVRSQMDLCGSAVVTIVREMGNGVDRIEAVRLVERFAREPDSCAVDLTGDQRMFDLVAASLAAAGFAAALGSDCLVECSARVLGPEKFELVTWLTMMLG